MKKSRFFKESKLRKYKDKAADLIEKGKYEKALSIYRDILDAFPNDTTMMLKLGDLCRRMKMFPEAVAVYSAAAEYHAQSGRLLQAIAVCRVILEIDASHSETQRKLAALYAQKYGSAEHSGVLDVRKEVAKEKVLPAEDEARLTDADVEVVIPKRPEKLPPVPRAVPSAPPIPVEVYEEEPETDLNVTARVNTLTENEIIEEESSDIFSDEPPETLSFEDLPGDDGALRLDFTPLFENDEEPSAVYEQEDLDEYLAELKAEGLTEELEAEERELYHEPRTAAERNLILNISRPAPPPPVLPPIPLFSSLSESALFDLINDLPLRHFDALETVVKQGEHGNSFFVIVSGCVEIFRDGESLATLEEGAFFGEMAMLFPGPRHATVVTAEPCELFEISNDQLDTLKKKHPRVASVLLEFAEERLLNNLLNTSPLFAPFSATDRQSLMDKFEPYLVESGSVVIQEGEYANGLYVVVIGQISVTMQVANGEAVEVETLNGNDIFGEVGLLTHQRSVATFTANKQSRVLLLPREKFNELIMTHPQVLELLASLSETRLAAMNDMKERVYQAHRGVNR